MPERHHVWFWFLSRPGGIRSAAHAHRHALQSPVPFIIHCGLVDLVQPWTMETRLQRTPAAHPLLAHSTDETLARTYHVVVPASEAATENAVTCHARARIDDLLVD
jgi:hypothetical protein